MSFREAFTKNKEQLLDYDDNAACYFLAALLLVLTLPVFLYGVNQVRALVTCSKVAPRFNSKGERYTQCKCSLCAAERRRRCVKERKRVLKSKQFWITFVLVLVLAVLLGRLVYSLSRVKDISSFDPFEILGVASNANEKQIRRAFRTLSLKHHPDRNPNDPASHAKFVMLSKAYQALTDEAAKKNFERYGNPDGPGAMKVGIGLPSFIVAEENQGAVLMFCVAILVVVVPLFFLLYYVYGTSKYYPNGVLVESVHLFGTCLKATTAGIEAVELLANSAESREQPYKQGDVERLKKSLCSELPVQDRKMQYSNAPIVERNFLLLVAHLSRKRHLIPPDMVEHLEKLLAASPAITQSMIEIAIIHHWFECVKYLVDFRRCLVQASLFGAPYVIQLPHATPDLGKRLGAAKLVSLRDFIKEDKKEVRDAVLSEMLPNETYRADIAAFIDHVPNAELSLRIETMGESVIAVGDLVTVTVTVDRPYLKKGEAAGPVHAPLFPVAKKEEWYFFLAGKRTRNLISYVSVSGDGRTVTSEEMKFAAPPQAGMYMFELVVMCDSYIGLDLVMDVPLKVASREETARDVLYVHPDDLKLDQQPSLLSQVLGVPTGDEEDEEEEDDDQQHGDEQKKKIK